MGRSLLVAALLLGFAAGPARAEVEAQAIFHDPLSGTPGQHATAVEPDSFSFGNTVVAAFQVGRLTTVAADAIGWATSTDGGRTWRSGLLPGLTSHSSPPGPYSRATDPVVAYDRVHGVWLISVLAFRDPHGAPPATEIVVSRSSDGLSWSPPVVTSPSTGRAAHDKNWIACDNGTTSPFAGRCYTAWTDFSRAAMLVVSTSSDGGLTWGPPVDVPDARNALGAQPVARPDGSLVVVYLQMELQALHFTRSVDGGATFSRARRIVEVTASGPSGLRAPTLPSAEIDMAGRIYVAWHDCRFRGWCPDAPNDIVVASSPDGVRWSLPARVPISPPRATVGHVIPGLAVDPTTAGPRARLAVVFYSFSEGRLTPQFASSSDAGQTWSSAVTLTGPFALADVAQTPSGAMVGDYVSTSFVDGGVAVPVFSAATAPFDGSFHQPILAAAVAPLPAAPLRVTSFATSPRRPRPGRTLTATLRLVHVPAGARVACAARAAGRPLRVIQRSVSGFSREQAECTWRVPLRAGGALVRGSISVRRGSSTARRSFAVRVRS